MVSVRDEVGDGIRSNLEDGTWEYINCHIVGEIACRLISNIFLTRENIGEDVAYNIYSTLQENFEKPFKINKKNV